MRHLALALLCVVLAQDALAGAWTLSRGESNGYLVSSFTYGDHFFDENGNLVPVPEYRKFELTGTVERGFTPWLTGILKGEVKSETQTTEIGGQESTERTFGSVAAGARLRLAEGTLVLSERARRCRLVRLEREPDEERGAGEDAGGFEARRVTRCEDSRDELGWVLSTQVTGLSGGFDAVGALDSSNGPALELRVLAGVGREVVGRDAFAELQLGYRERLREEDVDEVVLDLTLGAQVLPRWQVLMQSFSTFGTGEADTQSHKVGSSIVYQATRKARFEAGTFATVYGQNALREVGGRLGLWYSF